MLPHKVVLKSCLIHQVKKNYFIIHFQLKLHDIFSSIFLHNHGFRKKNPKLLGKHKRTT